MTDADVRRIAAYARELADMSATRLRLVCSGNLTIGGARKATRNLSFGDCLEVLLLSEFATDRESPENDEEQ